MEPEGMHMLLQSMSRRGLILTFLTVLGLFVAIIIIGIEGPHINEEVRVHAYACPGGITDFDPKECPNGVDLGKNHTMWTGEIRNLDKLNEQLILTATIQNKLWQQAGVSKTVRFLIATAGKSFTTEPWTTLQSTTADEELIKCDEGAQSCHPVTLVHEPFLKYSIYQFNISIDDPASFIGDVIFTFQYTNQSYTLFELWFRFSFLMVNFLAAIVFAWKLRTYSWSTWSFEQRWVSVMLFGLMGYNNPVYGVALLVPGWAPIFVNELLMLTFIAILFLYWIVMLHGLIVGREERTFKKFYLPKVILVVLFWITAVVVYTWEELHEEDDPIYKTPNDSDGFMFFNVVMLVSLGVYIVWVVYIVLRGCITQKFMAVLGLRLKFYGLFSIFIIVATLFLVVMGKLGPLQNSAAEFLVFLGMYNLYVLTITFVYLPSSSKYIYHRQESISMVRMDYEDDQDDAGDNEISIASLPTDPEDHEANEIELKPM